MQEKMSGVKEACSNFTDTLVIFPLFSHFHGYGSMQIKGSFDSRGRKD